ncbi:sigma-54 interaction domain-containing protein [candidate division KSB1 bacterium]
MRINKEAKKSNQYINTILESIADGVFTIDSDWKIMSFNSAAERITGVSREEAIGQYCCDIFRANICQSNCALRKTLKAGKEIINQRIDILNSVGERIPISISTAILKNENGEILGGVETFRDLSAVEELRKEIHKKYTFEDIISKNHNIQKIFEILPDIAESDSTVLIQGSSGTGKELFARAIHNLSTRKDFPFVAVSCGALPDTLLESELFGYVKGAFTDARSDKSGRFALAQKGTLFLDEIGDISNAVQVKLLRSIQEKEFEPLGSTAPVKADIRIISATNKNLSKLVKQGLFREDLYYRLNVIDIELPALKERIEDIPILIDHFIDKFNLRIGRSVEFVSDEVMEILLNYDFPGNVRELENIIERALVLCKDLIIEVQHLPKEIIEKSERRIVYSKKGHLKQNEVTLILETLKKNNWHKAVTAKELGIDKSTLWRKMKKYEIKK